MSKVRILQAIKGRAADHLGKAREVICWRGAKKPQSVIFSWLHLPKLNPCRIADVKNTKAVLIPFDYLR